MSELWVVDLGTVPYGEAVRLQEQLRERRERDEVPDLLLLLEHPPVITLGRGADAGNVLLPRDALRAQGIEVHESARGGDVTYHGPGQLVGYPILDLNVRGRDVHRYLRDVEETLIRVLALYGIAGERAAGLTGVWVGRDKIAAIGVGVRRWITWHGFALNVSCSLEAFDLIVPCGIRGGRGVTSLGRLVRGEVPADELRGRIVEAFCEVFEAQWVVPDGFVAGGWWRVADG